MSSIKEVAREAGVSTATVSHVINNTRYVSDEVRARVLKAIEQCRYYPNAHARSLASGKSKIIGLVISDIVNPFFPELVKAIEAAAFERGYDIVLSNTNYDTGRTSHYVQRFIERKVAGVAVMTSEMDKRLVDELALREVPVVFLDVGEPGLHMNNLRVDYDEGIEQAILHLVALGHRRIAFIGGNTNLRSSLRRLEAFRKTMRQLFPAAPELVFYGNFRIEGGQRAASEILAAERRDLPTAVVCANDLTAIGAISEFEAAGLNVPRDISVVGFDNIAFAALTKPALTTVNLPLNELGRRAIEVLIRSVEDSEQQGIEVRIPTNLIIRQSTAPARIQPDGDGGGKGKKRNLVKQII
ncbi:MAG TPA: LacI family DNA-binding transcriptional regulator [Pyrinomonadaceae bacterium]|nr:LacI family DNA-binding transcriptional regulator [Pyrinomonadaceae bacterium]